MAPESRTFGPSRFYGPLPCGSLRAATGDRSPMGSSLAEAIDRRPSPILAIARIDQSESVQGEKLIDQFDRLRLRRDQRGEAAGGDDAGVGGVLAADAGNQAVDQRDVAVDQPRLDGLDGIAAHH